MLPPRRDHPGWGQIREEQWGHFIVLRPRRPARAARLTRAQVSAVLKRAGRRKITGRADAILAALRSPQLGQPSALTAAYAAAVRSLVAVIATLSEQVASLQGQVEAHFGRHRDAEIYLSQPGRPASSAMTRTATRPPGTARTTPAPPRSPAPPARRRPSPPGTCATTGSPAR